MSWTLSLSGSAILKAGVHANADIISGATNIDSFSTEAEGFICAQLHTDVVANTPADAEIVNAIADIHSSKVAMSIVAYDMGGYTDRREAETIIDVNDDIVSKGLAKLKDKENQRLST